MLRLATIAAALLLAALPITTSPAQAPTPAAAASSGTVRPGTYDLDIAFGGGTLAGTLVLTAGGDSLTGTLHVGDHDAPVRSLTRKGSHLTINVGGEGMKIIYDLDFTDDGLSGSFTYNGDPGLVTGKRRK